MKLKSEEVLVLAQLVFNKTNQHGAKACVKLFPPPPLQYPVCECMYFHPQQLDSIHVTILHKEEGAGLGFSLAGGADLENKVITVSCPGIGMPEAEWIAGGAKTCLEGGLCWETLGRVRTGVLKESHWNRSSTIWSRLNSSTFCASQWKRSLCTLKGPSTPKQTLITHGASKNSVYMCDYMCTHAHMYMHTLILHQNIRMESLHGLKP